MRLGLACVFWSTCVRCVLACVLFLRRSRVICVQKYVGSGFALRALLWTEIWHDPTSFSSDVTSRLNRPLQSRYSLIGWSLQCCPIAKHCQLQLPDITENCWTTSFLSKFLPRVSVNALRIIHRGPQKTCYFYFFWIVSWNIGRWHATSERNLTQMAVVLTLIMQLHYLVKCKRRSLTVYKNEFILDSARVGSEMIN